MDRPATRTRVFINLSFPELSSKYAKLPCDGVGIVRAEFFALSLATHPAQLIAEGGEDKFIDVFAAGLEKIAADFAPRPVIYRTLDLKSNEYAGLLGGEKFEEREENPMIGLRGCARYLADPASFRHAGVPGPGERYVERGGGERRQTASGTDEPGPTAD